MYGVTRMDTCEEVALVSFHNVPLQQTVLWEIFRDFAEAGINIDMISQSAPTSGHVELSFTCLDRDVSQVLTISKGLGKRHPGIHLMISSGNCKLQLFGQEMRDTPGVFAKAMSCLCDTQAELRLVTTSEVDISLLVSVVHLDEAVQALKTAFAL